jgi:Domain of unknown function (DUF6647)
MEALLSVIGVWVAANTGFSEPQHLPTLAFIADGRIKQIHQELAHRADGTLEPGSVPESNDSQDVVAFYDARRKTIFLSQSWDARSPADQSVLVHELVHHLQKEAGATYRCPGEQEKPAYAAQADWLALYDLSLESEFGIDALTLLVRTNCLL